ncbi:hypothetical protein AB0B54_33920 [Microbispora bryophytorum]|uniref:hypothetical protein n=1 Tax=Microbispora bryophytorum TaxID=1460882 RepID=UPI003410F6BB
MGLNLLSTARANWRASWASWRAKATSEAVTRSPVVVVTRTESAPKPSARTGVREG